VDVVTAALGKYMKHPVVTVTVTKFAPLLVYVGGDGVNKPGSYTFEPGWTVLEALASAGGLVARADLKKAVLIRRGAPQQPVPLDLERLVRKKDQAANVALQPGDVIQVPLLDLRVGVLGQVKNAGLYDMNAADRLSDAVARAGGYTDKAQPNGVGLIRRTADGKLSVATYHLSNGNQMADAAQNPLLETADIVYVPTNNVRWQDILDWLTGARLIQLLTCTAFARGACL
jgi:polysaccharide export outer membrane protein